MVICVMMAIASFACIPGTCTDGNGDLVQCMMDTNTTMTGE